MSTTKWRLTFSESIRHQGGQEPVYHIVADEFRAKGLCSVDLGLAATEIQTEGIPARMCKRCLALRSKSRRLAVEHRP